MNRVYGSFYRYRSFPHTGATEERRQEEERRIRAMFAELIFWFSNPSTLNDPFDCRPALLWSDDMAENRQRVEQACVEGYEKLHGTKPKRRAIQPVVTKVMQSMRTQEARNAAFWDAVDQRTGVLCLSGRWDIIQHWTYYAQEHSGFCIEFVIGEDTPLSAFQIEYVDERPTIDLTQLYGLAGADKNLTEPCVLTKASSWQHEDEIRILNHNDGNIKIPDGILKSITFGMNTSDDNVHWLRGICDGADLGLDYFRCAMDDRRFALTRNKI